MTPFKQKILDAVIPTMATWILAKMRMMEEMSLSAEARWEALRVSLQRLAERPRRPPHG